MTVYTIINISRIPDSDKKNIKFLILNKIYKFLKEFILFYYLFIISSSPHR